MELGVHLLDELEELFEDNEEAELGVVLELLELFDELEETELTDDSFELSTIVELSLSISFELSSLDTSCSLTLEVGFGTFIWHPVTIRIDMHKGKNNLFFILNVSLHYNVKPILCKLKKNFFDSFKTTISNKIDKN